MGVQSYIKSIQSGGTELYKVDKGGPADNTQWGAWNGHLCTVVDEGGRGKGGRECEMGSGEGV